MSVLSLISGRLVGEPRTFPTKTGGHLTAFKIKIANGSNLEFWEVVTFSDTAREELAGLGEGDALSAVGVLQVETYQWNGATRVKLKLTADRILALKRKPPKPKDKTPRSAPASGRAVAAASWAAPSNMGGAHDDDDSPF
jgi:single-stranded DNA-binding protein